MLGAVQEVDQVGGAAGVEVEVSVRRRRFVNSVVTQAGYGCDQVPDGAGATSQIACLCDSIATATSSVHHLRKKLAILAEKESFFVGFEREYDQPDYFQEKQQQQHKCERKEV